MCVLLWGSIPVLDARRRLRKAPRRKAGIELRRLDDSDSYSGRRRLARACGTFSAEPDPIPSARVLVRAADRVPGDRGHARARGRTRLARRADHDAVDRHTHSGGPRAAALRTSALSVRRPGCLLAPGRGDLVRRRTAARVHRQPRPRRVGSAFLLGNLRNPLKAGAGLVIVLVGIVIVVYNIPGPHDRRPRLHSPPVRGRLGRGLRAA